MLAGAAYFLAKKYEPEVTKVIVGELNKHLAVEVSVEDINLSLTQRFPYASLRMSNVVIPETGEIADTGDTLIFVKDLYLQIGLLDFFKQEYTITDAEVNTGFFRMAYDAQGKENFRFWKSESDTTAKGSLTITNVYFDDFQYSLEKAEDLGIDVKFNSAHARGNFGKEQYDIELDLDAKVSRLTSGKKLFYSDEEIQGDLTLNIDSPNKSYAFESQSVEIAGEDYSISGAFNNQNTAEWILNLSTEGADLKQALHLLPLDLRSALNNYNFSGETDLDVDLESNKNFRVDIDFEELEGKFTHKLALGKAIVKPSKARLSVLNERISLIIDHLEAKVGPGEILSRGSILNLSEPQFDLYLKGNLDLNEIKSLLNITDLDLMAGSVQLDGNLKGALKGKSDRQKVEFLKGVDFNGNISLNNGALKLKDGKQKVHNINGIINLRANQIIVDQASAAINSSEFEISGVIRNALPYIASSNESMSIEANFSSDFLDFNEIWNSSTSDTTYRFSLPESVVFDLNLNVGRIAFRNFEASEVKGKAYYKNGILTLNPLFVQMASGSVSASGLISQKSEDEFQFQTQADLRNIRLNKLFYAFEDFGQDLVKSSHLEGLANADLQVSGSFNRSLKLNPKAIKSEINLEVQQGELNDLESLVQIADYLRSNAFWSALVKVDAFEKKLRHIEFETLQNRITIDDEVVSIPKMAIQSSAMDINLSGTHTFNQMIDYSVNFKLSDLLRTGKKQDEEFGYIVDDETGLNVFLQMKGTSSNPEFSMDKDAARQKRKNQFEAEKNNFKSILKEEFGLFKNDTTLNGIQKEQEAKTEFEVEWDNLEQKKDSLSKSDKKKKKDNGWDDLDDDDDI